MSEEICSNCKHFSLQNGGWCHIDNQGTSPNGTCNEFYYEGKCKECIYYLSSDWCKFNKFGVLETDTCDYFTEHQNGGQ